MQKTDARILLVEDATAIRCIMKMQLQRMGFSRIHEAEDGRAALALLREEKVDLIISDWHMPGMSGVELLRQVRDSEETREIPFIMMTGDASLCGVQMAMQLRVNDLLLKPFSLELLERKIGRIMH
jgi:two-component system, chemotaxis family, chemotaxis protein CheY